MAGQEAGWEAERLPMVAARLQEIQEIQELLATNPWEVEAMVMNDLADAQKAIQAMTREPVLFCHCCGAELDEQDVSADVAQNGWLTLHCIECLEAVDGEGVCR